MGLRAGAIRAYLRHFLKDRSDPRAPVSDLRANVDRIASLFPAPPADVEREACTIAGRDALYLRARGARRDRTVFYLHGGGYVSGTIAMYSDFASRLSEAAGARVLLFDYRLAPEHPYPAAIDDAVAAYRAVLASGTRPSELVVAGDSAGGGLTLATMLALKDAEVPLPAAVWAISPWTDLAYRGASIESNREADSMIRVDLIEPVVSWYLGSTPRQTPYASPLYGELRGLPDLLLHVGSTEVLLDDSRRFAAGVREQGGRAELCIYDDLPHVFHLFAPYLPEARDAIRDAGRFLRAALDRASPAPLC